MASNEMQGQNIVPCSPEGNKLIEIVAPLKLNYYDV
jgi:hypothetical protein